jgi:lysine-specific demethylase 8
LEIAADPSCLPSITTKEQQQKKMKGDEQQHALIPCRNKCGHVYCSLECQQDDWEWGGHKELCTGCIISSEDDEAQHPLLKFKQHAVETNEIFLLIAQWLARIHNHNVPYHDDDRLNTHPYTDFLMTPWWDVTALSLKREPMGFAEAIALEKSLKKLCEESHSYLQEAWPEHKSSKWLTPLGMARLIGSLEQNCMGIRRKHALRQNIMEDVELRHSQHSQLIKCLERAGMIGDCCDDDDEEGEGDENEDTGEDQEAENDKDEENQEESKDSDKTDAGADITGLLEPEEEWDYSYEDIAEFLSNLPSPLTIGRDDGWDGIFTPLDGTAHFSIATKMNHSCDPNVVLLYKTRGWGRDHPLVAYCVALKDIAPEEELTLSYITSDDPYEERQAALANYGFVCTCPKCLKEKDGTDSIEPGPYAVGDDEEEDLFGDDEEDEEEDSQDKDQDDKELDAETKLENVVERLESILNKSIHAAIPIKYLAPVSNYVIQLAESIIKDIKSKEDTTSDSSIRNLLPQCITAIQERDFCLCRIVGTSLEFYLYNELQSKGSWPNSLYRESYWCASITAAIGFAHEGSFLVAMKLLDKAVILGQERKAVEAFFSYVELHAYQQMAAAPCPPAIECKMPDCRDATVADAFSSTGLSKPISSPVEELTCNPSEFAKLVNSLNKPAVMRGFAAEWPATKKWRNIDSLAREFGHRLIPIEVGSMSSGMKEELTSFRTFVSTYLSLSAKKNCWSLEDATMGTSTNIAYLAQHPLLDQIQALYDDVETKPCGLQPTNVNVWIGTGGTRTPLHFDSYDNLLIQLVGAKYVRLYGITETPKLYVSKDKSYGLQGNISEVDCEMEDFKKHPLAENCPYTEVLLLPGDCLFIPSRHWHYVRSLSTSISVNYWF